MRSILGDRNTLCIDWDERSLRIADARLSRSSVRIRKVVHVPVPDEVSVRDPASLGPFLRRTLAEHRIRTRRAIVDVPRQDAVLNLTPLPPGNTDELAQMVDVQAAKELPFAKDQAVIDFALAGERQGGMCDVWVAAVRTAVVDRYRQTIANAGLRLERIGLRPYANLAALDPNRIVGGQTLVVDIGPFMTEIDVIREGWLAYSRAASVSIPLKGLDAWSEEPPAEPNPVGGGGTIPLIDDHVPRPGPMEVLLIEVSRTIEAYRATAPGSTIDRIVLAGMGSIGQEVVERFEERFSAPTVIYDAPASIGWRSSQEDSAAPFSAAIGLALSSLIESKSRFDFLHPKEPGAGQRVRQRQKPVLVATVALFVAAAGVLAYHPIRLKKMEIDRLEKRVEYMNQDHDARQELLDQLADAEAWYAKNVIWIDQLKLLSDVFPSNTKCYITKVEFFTEKGKITIDLLAKDNEVATHIVDQVVAIQDKDGNSVFRARPGKGTDSSDPDYPVKDQVFIELEALVSES